MELTAKYNNSVIERGRDYLNNITYCVKVADFLYAEVKGSRAYNTKVNLKTLDGSCSCPYGTNCKHCVAIYLAYKKDDYINSDKFIDYIKLSA